MSNIDEPGPVCVYIYFQNLNNFGHLKSVLRLGKFEDVTQFQVNFHVTNSLITIIKNADLLQS